MKASHTQRTDGTVENAPQGKLQEYPQSEDDGVSTFLNLVAEGTTLAWNLVIPIVGGVLLGRYLDDRLGLDITWTLGLLALGVLVAFNNLYAMYVEHGRGWRHKDEEPEQGKDVRDEKDS